MTKPKSKNTVFLFSNGVTGVCEGENQSSFYQIPWLYDVLKRLQTQGLDIDNATIFLPGGRTFKELYGRKPSQFIEDQEKIND